MSSPRAGDFPEMQRGLPIEMAFDPNVMLVWQMNGEDLPGAERWPGASARSRLGRYRLHQVDRRAGGASTIPSPAPSTPRATSYINEDGTIIRPVREMPVKSVITSPVPDAELTAGEQMVTGFAWSGFAGIALVEVSIDGGEWQEAPIVEEAGPLSWVRFELPWAAEAGEHTAALPRHGPDRPATAGDRRLERQGLPDERDL